MPKFCKDCKWSSDITGMSLDCTHPNNFVDYVNQATYLVTGVEQPIRRAKRGADCTALRQLRDPETDKTVCGPDGKWWEAITISQNPPSIDASPQAANTEPPLP